MKCQFKARLLPPQMLVMLDRAGGRLRSSVLRQWALLGLDAVRQGVDLRARAAALCVGGDSAATLIIRVADDSGMGRALVELEPQLATGHGAIFAALAVLGWEQSLLPGRVLTGAAPVLLPESVLTPAPTVSLGPPADAHPTLVSPGVLCQGEVGTGNSAVCLTSLEGDDDDRMDAAGEGLLQEFAGE